MIGFRYEAWDEELAQKLRSFADLLSMFHHLLLRKEGDVDEALRMMKRLKEMGYIDKDPDLDQFARSLEEGKIISLKDGIPKLTPKGGTSLVRPTFAPATRLNPSPSRTSTRWVEDTDVRGFPTGISTVNTPRYRTRGPSC